MHTSSTTSSSPSTSNNEAENFYRHVLTALDEAGVRYLIGGAYAFQSYTGINRNTKDIDIFICRKDYPRLVETMASAGYQCELPYPHWLGKIHNEGEFVDVIFNSGNGVTEVDEAWFNHAIDAEVLGIAVKLCPIEEMIWSKAFIMERERFDGADIAHLLRGCSERIDWRHLLNRFGAHWRVLLMHLIAFGFVYPAQRNLVPAWAMEELVGRLQEEIHGEPPHERVCSGPLLSREQYLPDIREWGYQDARIEPLGKMTPGEAEVWTAAIAEKKH